MSLETLSAATERGNRALAHVVGVERGDQGQATALLLWRRFRGGLGGGRRADGAAWAAADLARTFILIGNIGRDSWGARGRQSGAGRRLGFGFAETLFGFQFGLALGFLVLAVTFFLGLAAGFGGFSLGLLDAFLAVAALGFLFRQTPLFHIADLRVGKRTGARTTLVLGQGTQHHAGTCAWSGRDCRAGEWRLCRGGRRWLG